MIELLFPFLFFSEPKITNYEKVVQNLQEIARQNPQTTQIFELGKNDSGQTIYGLKIGSGETNTLVVATHHGNEYGSTAVGVAMAKSLAEDPVKGQTTFVIPVLNVPGFNSRNRYEMNKDPNRNYPGPCGTEGPFTLKSTKLLADFLVEKNVVTSATLHTYAPASLYPWGISTRDTQTKDEALFIELSKASTVESQYDYGNSTEMLYAADGTYEDYAYWKHGIWSLLFELGYSHNPSESDIKKMIEVNVPGIRRFLEMAPKERSKNFAFVGKCDKTVPQRKILE